jgi:hypothetical protein
VHNYYLTERPRWREGWRSFSLPKFEGQKKEQMYVAHIFLHPQHCKISSSFAHWHIQKHFFARDCIQTKEGCNRGHGLSAAIKIGTPEKLLELLFLHSGVY